MPEIDKGKEYYAMQANLTLASAVYYMSDFINALFIIFLVLGIGRLVFMLALVVKEHRRNLALPSQLPAQPPLVSIIVPA